MDLNTFLTEKQRMDAILRAAVKNSMERGDEHNDNDDYLASGFVDDARGYVIKIYPSSASELEIVIKESEKGSACSIIYISPDDMAKATAEVDAQAA